MLDAAKRHFHYSLNLFGLFHLNESLSAISSSLPFFIYIYLPLFPQPFWPTGSGCARGVLSALDLAWMIRLYGMKMPPLAVLRERENVFKLLSVTDSKDLQKNHKAYTINPTTRYSNLNQVQPFNIAYLKKLYDTDDPENADYTFPEPVVPSRFDIGSSAAMPPPRSKRKSGKFL